jgi:putative ABC transport system permease protein
MLSSFLANLQSAVSGLFEHRNRTLLSATGIMVGSLAIVLLISIARGVQADIRREVEDLGVNVLVVLPTRIEEGQMFAPGIMGISYLQEADAQRLRKLPGVRDVTPLTFVGSGLKAGEKASPTTLIIAVRSQWFQMRPVALEEGTLFGQGTKEQVCVIGSLAKTKLFGPGSAVGKQIAYNGRTYRIIGVTKNREESSSLFQMGSFENVMYLPFDTVKAVQPNMQIDRIMVQSAPDFEPRALVDSMERTLGERLNRETYSVLTQEDLLKLVFKLMDILTWLLVGLTSIALFVGGVGIMTIMLMAVNERTKEIGIRKTLGARRLDVFQQFLTEAVVLGLVGGVMGLALSALVSVGLRQWTPIKPLITADVILLSFAVSIGVGAIFGLIPALRAAGKDPVESLRSQ